MHLADAFLDNHHVNAHTTASEALWAGVPVKPYNPHPTPYTLLNPKPWLQRLSGPASR